QAEDGKRDKLVTGVQTCALPIFKGLGGPIAIVRDASAEVKRGIADFAAVLANISVGLAIFNFLPVPALDGGRLVFLGVELVSGQVGRASMRGGVGVTLSHKYMYK